MYNKNKYLIKQAQEAYNKGDYNTAIDFYEKAIIEYPELSEIIIANIYYLRKKCLKNNSNFKYIFSIIMPIYNREKFLEKSIASVINQTFKNWELIIIDDGSTDQSYNIIQKYLDKYPNIKYIKNSHFGVSTTRNIGLKKCSGEFICYLDSDNYYVNTFLEQIYKNIQGKDICYCGYTSLNDDKNNIYHFYPFDLNFIKKNNVLKIDSFVHSYAMYKKFGGFDETLYHCQDWDIMLKYLINSRNVKSIDFNGVYYNNSTKYQRITNCIQPVEHIVKERYSPIVNWEYLQCRKRFKNKISIIVLFIDNPDLTINCIKSILDTTINFDIEIILVDNGSHMDTYIPIKRYIENINKNNIMYYRNETNLNFSLGNNIGFSKSTGEYIVFLNNDTICTENWLFYLHNVMVKNRNITFTQPLLCYPDNTIQGAISCFSAFTPLTYHLYKNISISNIKLSSRVIHSGIGACLMVRATDFACVKGFSSIFVNGSEDVDLCLKLYQKFKNIGIFCPKSKIIHFESKSKGRGKYIGYNRLAFYKKWNNTYICDDFNILKHDNMFPISYNINEKINKQLPAIWRINSPILYKNDILKKQNLNILIVKPAGIGNFIMFLPALNALKNKYPYAKITVICFKAEAELAKFFVDNVIAINKTITGSAIPEDLNVLKNKNFDIAIYPPFTAINGPNIDVLKRLAKIHITHPSVNYAYKHEVIHNMEVMAQLGVNQRNILYPKIQKNIDGFNYKNLYKKYVVIHVGSSNSPFTRKKRWPLTYWKYLCEKISNIYDNILFVGGKDDLDDTCNIIQNVSKNTNDKIINLVNKKEIMEVMEIINSANLFISNDSGIMHLAAMTSVTMISIFGPTTPSKNRPWRDTYDLDKKTIILTPNRVACAPCYLNNASILNTCNHQKCLESITVNTVMKYITLVNIGNNIK